MELKADARPLVRLTGPVERSSATTRNSPTLNPTRPPSLPLSTRVINHSPDPRSSSSSPSVLGPYTTSSTTSSPSHRKRTRSKTFVRSSLHSLCPRGWKTHYWTERKGRVTLGITSRPFPAIRTTTSGSGSSLPGKHGGSSSLLVERTNSSGVILSWLHRWR
jgi:hypothetical protein